MAPPHGIISTAGFMRPAKGATPGFRLQSSLVAPWLPLEIMAPFGGPRPQRHPVSLTSLWWAVCVGWWPGRMVDPLKKMGVWLENASLFSFNWKSWQLQLASIQMIPQACSQTWQHHVQHLLYQVWKVPRGGSSDQNFPTPTWFSWHRAGYSDGIPWLP